MKVSVKSPIYVVQKFKQLSHLGEIYYYTASETEMFVEKKKNAFIFYSLESADRIAKPENAEIRVITDQITAKEFGIEGDNNELYL